MIAVSRNVDGLTISNNVIDCYFSGESTTFAIKLSGSSDPDVAPSNVLVIGNNVTFLSESTATRGVFVQYLHDQLTINDNMFTGDHQYSVYFGLPIDRVTTCDNLFKDFSGSHAIYDSYSPSAQPPIPANTNDIRDSNNGFVTRNSGEATIPSGNTSVAVSHGISARNYTPALCKVNVTPTNNLGNATKFWISNVTTSQFTINVDTDPQADADFVWTIDVNRFN